MMDFDPERIVVRDPNWLGDTVMALPALRALRARWPRAQVTVVGRWAPLLAGQGVADLALGYPRPWRERVILNRALGRAPADLAVILPNSLESAIAARLWRAPRRLGFDTDGRRPLLTDARPLPRPRLHQVDEYALLLTAVGVEVTDRTPAWSLVAQGSAAAEARDLLARAGCPDARPVGLHLGAAFGSSKLWPPASLALLAAKLDAAGLTPLLLGTAQDEAAARTVTSASGREIPSLVGRDRPELLPHVLARLACLVSGDTGVAHLAAALGVPTVTLFGPTDPALTRPRSARAQALWRGVPCAPCFLERCPIDHVCLTSIAPDEVEQAVMRAARS